MDKQYAYSLLDIKAMDEEGGKRVFRGLATTPTPDRVGDIVEPKGAEFKLPVPLLWQHNSGEPIGWVRSAKVTANGIEVECEVHNESAPGKLKDRLDEAWQSMKAKLVGGLSIGFKPLESNRIGDTYSYRFVKWLWLELSAVTVPANGDCTVQAIKSADQAIRRAASGARPVVWLDTPPVGIGKAGRNRWLESPAGQAWLSAHPEEACEQLPGVSGQQRRKGVVYLN